MIVVPPDVEVLARGVALRRGITPEEAVRAAVERYARASGVVEAPSAARDPAAIAAGIAAIARGCASTPVYDDRSADEIIGYDDHGVPK